MSKIIYENCDCMVGMAKYPDKHFDLAIVDPPYGIGKTWLRNRNGNAKHETTYKNNSTPDENYFQELKRVSKEYIIWGANFFTLSGLWPTKNVIVWDKECTWENDFKSECEIAITSLNHRPASIFRHVWAGARKGPETGINIIHPHQKPIALYKWLLHNYAKPGDLILDTHVGSASSLIACHDMGFDAVGFEIDETYYKQSMARLTAHLRQIRLDDLTGV